MTRDSVQPRDRIFVKGYGFLSFGKNMGKNIGKNISKKLSGDIARAFLIMLKKSVTDALKTSAKEVIQKTAEASCDLTGNKAVNKITKVSKNLQQSN